jgi:hypothetical protein
VVREGELEQNKHIDMSKLNKFLDENGLREANWFDENVLYLSGIRNAFDWYSASPRSKLIRNRLLH